MDSYLYYQETLHPGGCQNRVSKTLRLFLWVSLILTSDGVKRETNRDLNSSAECENAPTGNLHAGAGKSYVIRRFGSFGDHCSELPGLVRANIILLLSDDPRQLQVLLQQVNNRVLGSGYDMHLESVSLLQKWIRLRPKFDLPMEEMGKIDKFCYLDSKISSGIHTSGAVSSHTRRVRLVSGPLRRPWHLPDVQLSIKSATFTAAVRSATLCGLNT